MQVQNCSNRRRTQLVHEGLEMCVHTLYSNAHDLVSHGNSLCIYTSTLLVCVCVFISDYEMIPDCSSHV